MRSEIATRATQSREFRERVRHFMVRSATVLLDRAKDLARQERAGEVDPAIVPEDVRRDALLARQIMANPDTFVVPLCIAVCGHPALGDDIEEFLHINDDDLAGVVADCMDYLQVT